MNRLRETRPLKAAAFLLSRWQKKARGADTITKILLREYAYAFLRVDKIFAQWSDCFESQVINYAAFRAVHK